MNDMQRMPRHSSHSVTKLLHLCLVTGSHGSLVIAEDSDLTIAVVVKLNLLRDREVLLGQLLEQLRHGVRRVVRTEDLGRETCHVRGQMLVQL